MKYCRVCKLRAKDAETVCARCGGALTLLGTAIPTAGATGDSAAADAESAGPVLTLQGTIRELEHAHRDNVRRGRVLLAICGGALALLLLAAYEVYASTVLSYAVLENLQITQDPSADKKIRVSFNVVKPGRVAFDRRSGSRHTEKRDLYSQAGPVELSWSWPSEKQTGIDFNVIYRTGLTRKTERRHFDVTEESKAVDIVFLLDTTGSMNPSIEGLQKKCRDFAEIVRSKGYDCRLGLIGFGDLNWNESISVLEPTDDIAKFQEAVRTVPRTSGGDEPESSLEALERALKLSFRPQAAVCFVHITDASCHHRDRIPEIAERLKERQVSVFFVAKADWQNLYGPMCVNGGQFFTLDNAGFADSLLKIAGTIASQISYH